MTLPQVSWLVRVAGALRALGPYAAIELLLPGGSLIALSVWAYRHRALLADMMRRVLPSNDQRGDSGLRSLNMLEPPPVGGGLQTGVSK